MTVRFDGGLAMDSTHAERGMEQLVDWRAAVIAGLIAGAVFLPIQMVGHALATGGTVWIVPRYIAAIMLGTGALPPPPTFDAGIFLVALLIHFVLSVIFAMILKECSISTIQK